MDCGTVRRALSALAAGELAAERIGVVEEHLRDCEDCRRFARFVETAGAHLRSGSRPRAPEGLTGRILARIRAGGGRVVADLPLLRAAAAAAAVLLLVTSGAIFLTRPRVEPRPLELTADSAVDRIMEVIVRDSAPALTREEGDR